MKNRAKIAYLNGCIKRLKEENAALKQESRTLLIKLEENKTAVLLRQRVLDEKEAEIDKTKNEYDKIIAESKKIRANYEKAIKTVKKYETEIMALLKRLRKQRN